MVALIEASFFAAFALILDFLPSIQIGPFISISVAMLSIFILAFRRGFKVSLIAGFLWGLLQIVLGDADDILTPAQGFMEYFVAFSCIGFAGLFHGQIQECLRHDQKKILVTLIIVGTFVGGIARYFWHFLAGVIFWGMYAPKGTSPVMYSLIVNGGTMLGSAVLCSVVLVLLITAAPRILHVKSGRSEIYTRSA